MMSRISFLEASRELMRHYRAGDYAAALEALDPLARAYPDQEARLEFWRACLLARLERLDDALDTLTEALDRGLWWSEREFSDPDLEPLRGRPELAPLLAVCRRRHAEAEAASRPGLIIAAPTVPVREPLPLILTLHGRGGDAESDRPYWEQACGAGWLVASAQSSQLNFPGAHVWDDFDRARAELQSHLDLLRREYPLDPARIVLGGFSQGASLAARLTATGALPAVGFIAVAPGGLDVDALALSARPGPRGYVISGGQDPNHSRHAALAAALTARGLPCAFEPHDRLGHEFPAEFGPSLAKALSFLFPTLAS